MNLVIDAIDGSWRELLALPFIAVLDENRNQVFGARENEDVGLFGVAIPRQSLVGLARDRGK